MLDLQQQYRDFQADFLPGPEKPAFFQARSTSPCASPFEYSQSRESVLEAAIANPTGRRLVCAVDDFESVSKPFH